MKSIFPVRKQQTNKRCQNTPNPPPPTAPLASSPTLSFIGIMIKQLQPILMSSCPLALHNRNKSNHDHQHHHTIIIIVIITISPHTPTNLHPSPSPHPLFLWSIVPRPPFSFPFLFQQQLFLSHNTNTKHSPSTPPTSLHAFSSPLCHYQIIWDRGQPA